MMPYYLLVILVFLLVLLDFQRSRPVRLAAFTAVGILLFLFAGLRSVGTDNDSLNYEEIYNSTANLAWTDILRDNYGERTMERGYVLLNKLALETGAGLRTVFIVMAALSIGFTLTLIWKESPYPFAFLLFYVCFFYFYRDFTQIRYALAAALGMQALFCFIREKHLPALYFMAPAVLLHNSVLVLFLLALTYRLIKNQWFYLLLPVAGFLASLFDPVLFLLRIGGLPPILIHYVEQADLGRGGYVPSVLSQLVLIGVFLFRGRLLQYYSERRIQLLYAALSLGSFINLTFISFAIMQRLSLLLFGAGMFLLMYLFRTLSTRPSERHAVLTLQLVFNIYVCYYGLRMVGPDILQPYQLL